jgi:hypothetical protein
MEDVARAPGRAQRRQDPAVESPPSCRLPGQNEEEGNDEEYGVRADRSGEQIVHIHERPKERGNAGEEPQDQREADEKLAPTDQIAPESGMA